jgi:hypothetical protein
MIPAVLTLIFLGSFLLGGCAAAGANTPAVVPLPSDSPTDFPTIEPTADVAPSPFPTPTMPFKPAALLAIATLPRSDPPPTTGDIIAAVDLAFDSGARGSVLTTRWHDLEPSNAQYHLDEIRTSLNYLGNFRGFDLLLGIQVLNTTAKETPTDLKSFTFDSQQMKNRFHELINMLLPDINDHVRYLSIGNEVDVYLAAHPKEWSAYEDFYDDAVRYIHAVAPHVKVGVTSTFSGASGASRTEVARLNESSDVLILTYYPLGERYMVRGSDAPRADLPRMVELAKPRPLVLQEVGYPSAAVLGSSEEKQAQFVANVFAAWKPARASIPFISFFALHDWSASMCDELTKYYGLPGNANFKAYLCSLGLHRADGTPKRGWQTFINGAASMK